MRFVSLVEILWCDLVACGIVGLVQNFFQDEWVDVLEGTESSDIYMLSVAMDKGVGGGQ